MATATAIHTAPLAPDAHLRLLTSETARLWVDEPLIDPTRRQALLTELADLEVTLERLSLRSTQRRLHALDRAELDQCTARLERLRCHWRPGH